MKLSKYIMMASAPMLLASCLDTEPLGNYITSDQKQEAVEQNPERLEASVTAITTSFSTFGTVRGNDVHSDIGYPSIMLLLESRGVDMVSKNIGYNWFGFALTYDDIDYTYGDNRMIWQTLYNQIYSANNVTKTVDAETENAQLQGYLAQALAIRAFDYFTLAQCYQKSYAYVDPNTALGVPLITETNQDDAAANGCPRATLQETYDQILNDINKAIELLDKSGYRRTDKRYVDLCTAHAIRARVNLVMKNYSAALEDANFVISNSSARPLSIAEASRPGFNDIDANNWLWGIKVNETDRGVATGICNFPSHMGSLSYGYATVQADALKKVNKKLFNNINESDARKGWFLDEDGNSNNLNAAETEYLAALGSPAYTQVKFGPYQGNVGTSTNASDIPLIRIEEMYMIKAECEAQTDPATGAATLQSFVRQYRDPQYTLNASSTEGVTNAVFEQRRIEFYGEGITWFDFIRLNKDFDRRGAGFDASEVYNIKAGDNCLIWRIPYNEMQYNKQITDAQNNPVGTKPTAVPDL